MDVDDFDGDNEATIVRSASLSSNHVVETFRMLGTKMDRPIRGTIADCRACVQFGGCQPRREHNMTTRRAKISAWGGAMSHHVEEHDQRRSDVQRATEVLTNKMEILEDTVKKILSEMFPTNIQERPSPSSMERLRMELDLLERRRRSLVELTMSGAVFVQ